ncbi:probable cytochrome P450 6a14 [Photinus pyralis]|uniref:probable cytochrome P450 6a14 n=1 Tax=Photinus pyralis TaxID=7054 RepID=UPI001266F9ED|nr:probable cytochrome P450 6a14 [Photinus pyralis]
MLSIADYETSTPVISFCLYELAINADIQNKARDEVTEVLAKYNEDFCYDAVKDMTYLEKCVKETLRKYAPASVHPRECTKPYTDPHTGIEIDQGTLTFIPVHGLHMDPNIFPNPERFDPERFSNDAISSRHPCSWIPFGFGPRMCLGMKPGIAKVKVCLAKLLQHFEFSTSHLTEIPLVIKPRAFITKSANGVWLNMKKIN